MICRADITGVPPNHLVFLYLYQQPFSGDFRIYQTEIKDKFNDKFINMVHPDDRSSINVSRVEYLEGV